MMIKYYWIVYKERSYYDGKGPFVEIVTNVHPFNYETDSSSSRTLINWKEISQEEFDIFRGTKEILPSDYTPEKRIQEINERMSR